MSALGNTEFQAYTERIEGLVERVNGIADDGARSTALELLQAIMDLHGAMVSRVVEVLDATEAGRASLTKLGADPLICGLMVLYDVHPVPLEQRLARAMENLAPQLRKRSASAELTGVSEGVARVKVHSTGHGCGSSVDGLRETVDQAILEAAPEIVQVVLESDAPALSSSGFVPLSLIQPASMVANSTVSKEEKKYEESAA